VQAVVTADNLLPPDPVVVPLVTVTVPNLPVLTTSVTNTSCDIPQAAGECDFSVYLGRGRENAAVDVCLHQNLTRVGNCGQLSGLDPNLHTASLHLNLAALCSCRQHSQLQPDAR
jgi:hypothetical protein